VAEALPRTVSDANRRMTLEFANNWKLGTILAFLAVFIKVFSR